MDPQSLLRNHMQLSTHWQQRRNSTNNIISPREHRGSGNMDIAARAFTQQRQTVINPDWVVDRRQVSLLLFWAA
jgi:hypothetical protein